MRRKRLVEKETRFRDRFINSLEYSFTDGDNQMKHYKQEHDSTRLHQEVAEQVASTKSFKEVRRGDN